MSIAVSVKIESSQLATTAVRLDRKVARIRQLHIVSNVMHKHKNRQLIIKIVQVDNYFMIKIKTNKSQLINRIILGVIFLPIFLFFISLFLLGKLNQAFNAAFNGKDFTILIIILMVLVLGLFSVKILVELLFLPIRVTLNEFARNIKVDFLFLGSRTINIDEIESYGAIRMMSREMGVPRYNGVLIHLKDKRLIQYSNYNLQDYKPLVKFLDTFNVSFLGDEKFGFRNYYKNCIK